MVYDSYNNLEIKNEMQKIQLHIPPCNRCNHVIPGEEAAVARSVAREVEELEKERIALANAAEIERLERIARACELRRRGLSICNIFRRHNRVCECRYERDLRIYERELERRREFVDPTIYYRFVNQTLYNNLTGESNVNVTKLANKVLSERGQVEDILRKYRNRT